MSKSYTLQMARRAQAITIATRKAVILKERLVKYQTELISTKDKLKRTETDLSSKTKAWQVEAREMKLKIRYEFNVLNY